MEFLPKSYIGRVLFEKINVKRNKYLFVNFLSINFIFAAVCFQLILKRFQMK